jgi:hypothetical protein
MAKFHLADSPAGANTRQAAVAACKKSMRSVTFTCRRGHAFVAADTVGTAAASGKRRAGSRKAGKFSSRPGLAFAGINR